MGTWSTRIFDDDGAADIYAEYRILLGYKMDPEQAWQLIYNYFYPDFKDSDDEDVFWLSVALYQWQNGILKEEVKQRALECIDDVSYLAVWKESDPNVYEKRKAVLTQLKEKLINEVNPPRKIAKCPPYYRIKTRFSIGDVFSYTHENGNISYIEVVRIRKTPVTKLAPEVDYQSHSDFALLDVWSKRQYSLEELAELPYRRFYDEEDQRPYAAYIFDTISFSDEKLIQDNMNYLGNLRRVGDQEATWFGASGCYYIKDYTEDIENTFSLPCSLTNEMLNSALSEFLIDSTIETLENRIHFNHPEWSQVICYKLKKLVIRKLFEYINDVRSHHVLKREIEDRDAESLSHKFPWSNEDNAKKLTNLIIPKDEDVTMTEYSENFWKSAMLFYDSFGKSK